MIGAIRTLADYEDALEKLAAYKRGKRTMRWSEVEDLRDAVKWFECDWIAHPRAL